jgi:hypothetical protein
MRMIIVFYHLDQPLVYLMLSVGLGGFWTIVILTIKTHPINPPLVYWILSVGLGGFRSWVTSTIEIYPINPPLQALIH